jgi:hypothetical protein
MHVKAMPLSERRNTLLPFFGAEVREWVRAVDFAGHLVTNRRFETARFSSSEHE